MPDGPYKKEAWAKNSNGSDDKGRKECLKHAVIRALLLLLSLVAVVVILATVPKVNF